MAEGVGSALGRWRFFGKGEKSVYSDQRKSRTRKGFCLLGVSEESNPTLAPFIFCAFLLPVPFKSPATTPSNNGRNHPQNTERHQNNHFYDFVPLHCIFQFCWFIQFTGDDKWCIGNDKSKNTDKGLLNDMTFHLKNGGGDGIRTHGPLRERRFSRPGP